jgi:replicative DNA helicase
MTANDIQRSIPQSIESEQSVIGALLIDNDAIDRLGDLKAEHFFRADHRLIFTEIVDLISASIGADMMTVFERLQAKGRAVDAGGLAYLNALSQNTPSSANITRYAEIVRDRAQKRGLLALSHEIQDSVGATPDSAAVLIDQASAKLEKLGEAIVKSEPVHAGQSLADYLDYMDQQIDGLIKPVPTGLTDLDRKLGGGFYGGDLVIVAARPSMGKTAFSLTVAKNVSRDMPVLFLSMEMKNVQLQQRLVSSVSGVTMAQLRDPASLDQSHWYEITEAAKKIKDLHLYLDDQPNLTLLEVRSKARAVKRKHGLSLLVVDYLGLMATGSEERRDLQIGALTKGLKNLAKELDVPVILLSQLSRKCEERPNKRPLSSDLKDSGDIEADADTILFLYRDEVYNPDSPDKGICEVICTKQRQGETGITGLVFHGERTLFEDLAHGHGFGQRSEPDRPRTRSRGMD